MGGPNDTKQASGRPEHKVPSREVNITSMDPVTFKMLGALTEYGRFGKSKQEIVLFILRSWLWENEARLKAALASAEMPLGQTYPESE